MWCPCFRNSILNGENVHAVPHRKGERTKLWGSQLQGDRVKANFCINPQYCSCSAPFFSSCSTDQVSLQFSRLYMQQNQWLAQNAEGTPFKIQISILPGHPRVCIHLCVINLGTRGREEKSEIQLPLQHCSRYWFHGSELEFCTSRASKCGFGFIWVERNANDL